jgi:hypothetical protein
MIEKVGTRHLEYSKKIGEYKETNKKLIDQLTTLLGL